jgi:hypothetical protein
MKMPSFMEKFNELRAERGRQQVAAQAEQAIAKVEPEDAWIAILRGIPTHVDDEVETVTTAFCLEFLDVEPREWLGAAKRLRRCMLQIGFMPIRQFAVNRRGYKDGVRAYSRLVVIKQEQPEKHPLQQHPLERAEQQAEAAGL